MKKMSEKYLGFSSSQHLIKKIKQFVEKVASMSLGVCNPLI